jgi:predicted RNA-binding protein with PIN domain
VADASLYLFDGYNLLRASGLDDMQELVDKLASFVALRGARGIVVFDGSGQERAYGALEVRYAEHADALLERLAADNRDAEQVCLVSSDLALRGTSGQEVMKVSSAAFVQDLHVAPRKTEAPSRLGDRLEAETRDRLERLRRGE